MRALIWLLVICDSVSIWAVNPSVRVSQYGHTAWRIRDGFFDGAPWSIAQTADGYLWIGGGNGLIRFDGVRFVPFSPPAGKKLQAAAVARVLAARDGSLWIGTWPGFSHWTNHDLINFSSFGNAVMGPTVEEEDGTIWILRAAIADETGPLCQVKGIAVRCYGKADGFPAEPYSSLARDSSGNFWLGGSNSLTRWRPGSFQTYYLTGLKSNAGQPGVCALASRPDGSLWVGMCHPGPGLGLQQFSQGVWKPFVVPGFDSSTLKVLTLFVDRQNALWVGTVGQGVYRIYGQQFDHFDNSEGLSGDTVYAFAEDSEGDVWVATDKGLDCFRDLKITTLTTRQGLTTPAVGSVQIMKDGTIWIGGENALDILSSGLGQDRVVSIQAGKGLPGNQVTSLFEDHAGRHWVGIDNTLNIYENGRFTSITKRDGSPTGMIIGITQDIDNNLWALSLGPPRMLIRVFNRKALDEIPTPQIPAATSLVADRQTGIWLGLLNGDLARYQRGRIETFHFEHPPNSRVNQLLLSSDGSVLAATTYGLIRWSNGTQRTLSAQTGLPCDGVNGVVEDSGGGLWLYMQCGLVEIARSDFQRWLAQPNVRLQPRVFGVFDGFQSGNRAPFESKAVRTLDGRLWFATAAVLQMIDPAHFARNSIPPAVHVEQIMADRKIYPLQGKVHLPVRARDVQIDYTALSLTVPQEVRFRYQLEGRDTDWEEAGTRREAFYTDLGPGSYRFHVIASNNDGVWNEVGASLNFSISPAYYQTYWFRAASFAFFMVLIWMLYRLRVHSVELRYLERHRAEELLRRAQAELAHINRVSTIGEVTASLAHEIKQPLTAALTNAETCLDWLRRDRPDIEEGCEAAAHVVSDVSRAAGIINSVSGLFKKGPSQRGPVDVNDLIREMVELLRNEALRNSVTIRTDLAENVPRVNADRLQLQQVFMNLMLNGIDAMKNVTERGELSIKSEVADGQVLISVIDAGVGLPPDHEDRIFKAFFTTKEEGTGMGLSISRSIVESHGGRLWATANSGKGATFRFTLPAMSGAVHP